MADFDEDDYIIKGSERVENLWRCEEYSCGHEQIKPWPKDREKFYARGKSHKCLKCKSESLMPHGF